MPSVISKKGVVMNRGGTRALTGAIAILFSACEGREDATRVPGAAEIALVPFATVRLRDRDTAYIAKSNALAVSSSGEFFVTDMLSRRILRFDKNGEFLEAIGRHGRGPNEFEGPSRVSTLDDSTLAVIDGLRREAVLWNLRSKSAVARLPLPSLASPLVRGNDVLYPAATDYEHGTAGLRWRSPRGAPERLGRMLDVYRNQRFASIWGEPAIAVSGDSILYFGGRSEYLVVADSNWQPFDSLPIPRAKRRGIPREIDYSLGNGRNIYDVMAQVSVPFGLHSLSGSGFAVLHLDFRVVNNTTVVGQAFMTVLASNHSARCVDVTVPTNERDVVPRISFLGDTLFVLDQFERDNAVVVEIKKYHIRNGFC